MEKEKALADKEQESTVDLTLPVLLDILSGLHRFSCFLSFTPGRPLPGQQKQV